jgi:hypothetical protein
MRSRQSRPATQWIRVLGAGASNPVILLIQQGPGPPMINEARRLGHLLGLEQAFTVIYWDPVRLRRSPRRPHGRDGISLERMMGDTVSLQRLGCGAGHHGLGHSDRPARGAATARHKLPAATVTAWLSAAQEPTGRSASSRQEKSMDKAARTRQRVLALFLPIAALLYISAEALSPKGTDQVIQTTATAFKVLAIAAKHPTQLYVAGSLALLGLGALAVSYAAIATLVRNRGSAVATVAALIGESVPSAEPSSTSWSIPTLLPPRRHTCQETRPRGSW